MNYFYIRVSCKTVPMDNQIIALDRFIKQNDLLDYKLIKDISIGYDNISGNFLFDFINELTPYDTLYSYDISRISRSLEKLLLFNQHLSSRNIKFVCVNPSIEDVFVKNQASTLNIILSNITELETEYISIIAKNALSKLKQQGIKLGAPPKYDETVIAKVKELKARGMSCQAMAIELGMSKASAARLARIGSETKETIDIDIPINIKLEMWSDWKMGMSKKDLSKKYKLDIDSVSIVISSLKGGGHW